MSELEQVIQGLPDQLRQGWELADDFKAEGKFKNIVVCGMGGSLKPGRILRLLLTDAFNKKKIKKYFPVILGADYSLPPEATKDSLVLCISYSGNTEETLEVYRQARDAELEIFTFSAGGQLEELAVKNSTPHIKIPRGVQPRMAIGYFMGAILRFLTNSKIIDGEKIISQAADSLEQNLSLLQAEGKKLAMGLKNKIPIIYASSFFAPMAMTWKINFNENVKIPAFFNEIPEMNHNEINGFVQKLADFKILILQDENDHPRIIKRMAVMKQVLEKKGIEVVIINIPQSEDLLYKIMALDLISYSIALHLAQAYGIDPIPVAIVEEFKKLMG